MGDTLAEDSGFIADIVEAEATRLEATEPEAQHGDKPQQVNAPPVPPKLIKVPSGSSLAAIKPDFELGAIRFPDLRMYLFRGDLHQEATVRLHLHEKAEKFEFYGLRPTDTRSWNIDQKKPAPTCNYVTLCGGRIGASRFLELAHGAGCCADKYLSWASEYCEGTKCFGPEKVWIDSIFRVAWEHRSDILLRAQKGIGGKLPGGCFVSFLPMNPFRASVVLIDALMDEAGEHVDALESARAPTERTDKADDAGGEDTIDERGKRNASSDAPPKRKIGKTRGRIPDTDKKEDQRIVDAWGTRQYRTYEELGREIGKTKSEVGRAIDRHRKRRKAPE